MKQQFEKITARWKAFSPGQRMGILAAVAAVVVAMFVMQSRANQVDWAVLYANLDDVTASDAMAQLDARGLTYELDGNGTRILVPTEELASTRLALAGDGITGQAVPPGFEEVFSGQGLAASDFEQKVNYERALEGELSRTLLTMEPVRGASVQLSLPDDSVFVGSADQVQNPASASVVLSLGRELSTEEVDTVANVIAASVDGLDVENVTIASSSGELLRAAGQGGGSGSSGSSMDMAAEFEAALAGRLTDLARTLTGTASAQVQVRADLDFTESTVEQETIDPESAMTTAEQVLTETWTGAGNTVGGTTGVDGQAGAATGRDGSYEKSDSTTTYTPGDRTITRSTTSTPTLRRLSVAVVIPVAPDADGAVVPPVDEQTVQRVLASAAGLDTTRGDTIEVASVPATAADTGELVTDQTVADEVPAPSPTTTLVPGIAIGAGVMLAIGLLARRRRRKKAAQVIAANSHLLTGTAPAPTGRKGRQQKTAVAAAVGAPLLAAPLASADMDVDRQAIEDIRADLERMVSESPESLAALLSSWMAK